MLAPTHRGVLMLGDFFLAGKDSSADESQSWVLIEGVLEKDGLDWKRKVLFSVYSVDEL